MSPATAAAERHRRSLRQFLSFGLIGGSGVLVNMATLVVVTKVAWHGWGAGADEPLVNLLGTPFHVRWYHLFYTVAFLVANLWNFQLNRTLTFRSRGHARWWSEFVPFFLVGAGVFAVGLLITTALVNPTSPVALPRSVFDGSSGLRNPYFWANPIQIALTMPLNFVLAKVWAFRSMSSTNVAKRESAARAATPVPGSPAA